MIATQALRLELHPWSFFSVREAPLKVVLWPLLCVPSLPIIVILNIEHASIYYLVMFSVCLSVSVCCLFEVGPYHVTLCHFVFEGLGLQIGATLTIWMILSPKLWLIRYSFVCRFLVIGSFCLLKQQSLLCFRGVLHQFELTSDVSKLLLCVASCFC